MASQSPPPHPFAPPAQRTVVWPARKPVRRTHRISLFDREVRVRLSPAAVEVLLQHAATLSEGEVMDGFYGGSTMVTIDLSRASAQLSEACDAVTAHKLESLLATDEHMRDRIRSIAVREAEARANADLSDPVVELRVRREGRHFHLDMDIEAVEAAPGRPA